MPDNLTEFAPFVAALCLMFMALGYLLGRGPATEKGKRRWYKVPGQMCLPYDPQNPLNVPVERTDGWGNQYERKRV